MNSNLNFEFGAVWYRPKPEPGRTGLTGQTGPVPSGLVNPDNILPLRVVNTRAPETGHGAVDNGRMRKERVEGVYRRRCPIYPPPR